VKEDYSLQTKMAITMILLSKCIKRQVSFSHNLLEGNVILVLTRNKTDVGEEQISNEEILDLATEGAQPTLLFFEEKSRIFVWDSEPSEY
jgi:hypothetical protein